MPRCIPPPPTFEPVADRRPWRFALTLVTPMLGGGHKPREVDEITPISAKAIRGHLRFWWRYMCGSRLESATGMPQTALMRLRESEVFGGQDLGSPFDVVIENVSALHLVNNSGGNGAEGYVFFPLRETPTRIAEAGLSFTLVIRWIAETSFNDRLAVETKRRQKANREQRDRDSDLPIPFDLKEIRNQLNMSFWAWVNFGGLGSRTRRGLGCLWLGDSAGIGRHSLETKGRKARYEAPEIHRSKLRFDNPVDAWIAAVSAYGDFRQTPRGPVGPKSVLKTDRQGLHVATLPRIQGRTKWPEADSIRAATGCALAPETLYLEDGKVSNSPTQESIQFNDHTSSVANEGTLPAYPRAAMGLPIIFHFADGPKLGKHNTYAAAVGIPSSHRDPDAATLVPMVMGANGQMTAGDRMASPVITKPILLHDGWHAAVIILRSGELDQLQAQLNSTAGQTPVSSAQIMGPAVRGFVPMRGKENALDALGAFLSAKGFARYGAVQ